MALANTAAAIEAGAGYADVTLLGIGERAGNCDYGRLAAWFPDGLDLAAILEAERFLSSIMKRFQ
jgi:isopropylmalate/homocitrate/citramalate synthase